MRPRNPAHPIPFATEDVHDAHERRLSTTRAVEERLAGAEARIEEAEVMLASSALNWAVAGPFERAVHARIDQAGRWVRERPGCTLHREGNEFEL